MRENHYIAHQERRAADSRMRWIVYPCVTIGAVALFAAGAMLALGTFTRVQQPPLPPEARRAVEKMLQAQGMPPGKWDGNVTIAAWMQSVRMGDRLTMDRMQRQGKVITLSNGTPIWYQPPPGIAPLTPVRVMNGRHFGRTYWVESRHLQ